MKALGPGERARGSTGWFGRFLHDLFTPRGTRPVPPPAPRTREQYVRTVIVRGVVTQIISGPDTTLAEKAAFVFGPDVAVLAARHGAAVGARERWSTTSNGSGGRPGSIDV